MAARMVVMLSSEAFRAASAAAESLDAGQQRPLLDVVARPDQKFRDIAHGVRAYVDVILGLNLAGSGHEAGQVAAQYPARLHGDYAALAIDGAGPHPDDRNQYDRDGDGDLPFTLHDAKSPFLVLPL
jgi:hypothetical protein